MWELDRSIDLGLVEDNKSSEGFNFGRFTERIPLGTSADWAIFSNKKKNFLMNIR